jgi:thiol-disulfide isomerase/thioredoxin
MKKGVLVFWGIIIAVIVLAIGSSFLVSGKSGQYDNLAMCIKKQGVIFYGAYWCPHCQRTKGLFGSAAKYLPYVECSNPDGQSQTQVCIDHKISSYPTWVRPDGAILQGEHTLQEWAAFSGCTLDGQTTAFSTSTIATSSEASQVK